MNYLHKEKERVRHQKHVSLLNKVMEYVPRSSHEAQTKVRKLRRLIMFLRYIKMIHMHLRKELFNSKDCSSEVKDYADVISKCEIAKVQNELKRKNRRAHIVFLKKDKAERNSKEIICDMNTSNHNVAEANCNSPGLPVATKSEYKVPEVLPNGITVSSNTNTCFNEEISPPPCDSNTIRFIGNVSPSPEKCSEPRLGQLNSYEMEPNVSPDNSFYDEKENWQPFELEKSISNCVGKHIDDEMLNYDPESFVKNIQSFSSSEFKSNDVIQSPDNYILNDITYSNVKKNSFKISNPCENYPGSFENILYDSSISPNVYKNMKEYAYDNSDVANSTNIKPSYTSNVKSQFSNHTLPGNLCDNCSSSSSTERINIDVESYSDSYPPSSNSSHNSSFNSKSNSCDTTVHSDVSHIESIKYQPAENNYTLPLLSSYNYFPHDNLGSKIPYIPMYESVSQLYTDEFYPNYINLSEKSNSSSHPYYDNMMYPRYFSNDCPQAFLQPKSDIKTHNSIGCHPGINSDSYFNDEISYPFAHIFVNCKTHN